MRSRRSLGALCAVAGIVIALVLAFGIGGANDRTSAPREIAAQARLDELGLTTDVPRAVTKGCAKASRLAGDPVPCLTVVPAGRTVGNYVCRLGGCADDSGTGWVADFSTRRRQRTPTHWLIGSGRRRDVCQSVISRDLRAAVKRRSVRIAGRPAQLLRVPSFEQGGGVHGGHRVAIWRGQGRSWFVSMHGKRETAVRELAAGWMRALGLDRKEDDAAAASVECR